jgi:hypothetical protein
LISGGRSAGAPVRERAPPRYCAFDRVSRVQPNLTQRLARDGVAG